MGVLKYAQKHIILRKDGPCLNWGLQYKGGVLQAHIIIFCLHLAVSLKNT